MGYYIDFVFDKEKEKYNKENLLRKFKEIGYEVISIHEKGFIDLESKDGPFRITITPSKKEIEKGIWAHIRLSWATSSDSMLRCLEKMLDIADKLGCSISDGHTTFTREMLNEEFENSSFLRANPVAYFGKVKNKEYEK